MRDSSASSTVSLTSSGQTKAPPGSSSTTESSPQPPSKEPSRLKSRKSSDGSGKSHVVNSPPKPAATPGTGEGRRRSASSQAGDKCLAGASSGPTAPPQDGAGGPGGMDMAKMMSKGGAPALPGGPGAPTPDMMSKGGGGMPDMMSMMSKGRGMLDIMSMMAKGGGMPDMMSEGGGGMPDMMAMMAKGGMPDMKAMMGMVKGSTQKSPMGMAKLFDCIIEVSLANAASDVSDDDEDSVTIEIPCPYCSRLFTSQMSLKTHILVAHEHEDTSVLNLKRLVIDSKGKRSMKDHHGSRRKQSRDYEKSAAVEAAGTDPKLPEPHTPAKAVSSQEDLSAAESGRGLKRIRSGSKESEAVETSGAAGVEEVSPHSEHGLRSSARLGSSAVPSSCVPSSPLENRKRKARLHSHRSSSGDSVPQVTTKKSKGGGVKPDSDSSQTEESSSGESHKASVSADQNKPHNDKSHSSPKETIKHKKVKTGIKDPLPVAEGAISQRSKRTLRKDKEIVGSDTETGANIHPSEATLSTGGGRKGRQSGGAAAGHSSLGQGDESPSTTRRSLRSRKSR